MERLTVNNESGWALKLDNPQNDIEARQQLMSKFKIACKKLGEFEDFMEEMGFESLKELKKRLTIKTFRDDEKRELIVDGVAFNIEQQMVVQKVLDHKDWQIRELKDHIYDLNNKLLNLQLFLKDLRDSFHEGDETYEEIDKKLKELGGVDG